MSTTDLTGVCAYCTGQSSALQCMTLQDECLNIDWHPEQTLLVLQALCDIHKTRSHRDIKLANVMVSGWDVDGGLQLKIIDWGSSRLHEGTNRPHVKL